MIKCWWQKQDKNRNTKEYCLGDEKDESQEQESKSTTIKDNSKILKQTGEFNQKY